MASAAQLLRAGGWQPRSARVLAAAEHGDVVLAVIDTEGDGRRVIAEVFERADDGDWEECQVCGPAPCEVTDEGLGLSFASGRDGAEWWARITPL